MNAPFAFAFAVKDAQTSTGKWVVAGGESANGYESAVQSFTTNSSCTFTKLTNVAGFEWGSGFYINPTPPEDAAQFLRDVGARA